RGRHVLKLSGQVQGNRQEDAALAGPQLEQGVVRLAHLRVRRRRDLVDGGQPGELAIADEQRALAALDDVAIGQNELRGDEESGSDADLVASLADDQHRGLVQQLWQRNRLHRRGCLRLPRAPERQILAQGVAAGRDGDQRQHGPEWLERDAQAARGRDQRARRRRNVVLPRSIRPLCFASDRRRRCGRPGVALALRRHGARATKRIADLAAEALDRGLDLGRVHIAVAQVAPVQVLPLGDDGDDRIALLSRLVVQLRHLDVENGEDEVVAAEFGLAGEERVEFEPAILASYRGRGDDRDEEHRLADRHLELGFPQLAGGDRFLVLPESERLHRAAELPAQLALDALAQRRQRAVRILV